MKYNDEILNELLWKFVSKDPLHRHLSQPLRGEHSVYASDNHCAIEIENCCFTEVPNYKKNLELYKHLNVRRNCYREFTLSDVRGLLSSIPKMEEVTTEYAEEKCDECCGSGVVEWEYYSEARHRYYNMKYDCPVCGGDGYAERSVELTTGRLVLREDSSIEVRHRIFPAYAFELVAEAMEHLGLQATAITAQPQPKYIDPLRIDLVTAQIKVFIMPKTHAEDWQTNVPELKTE